ncbi:hypothetical protein Dret_1890 [Desulfohalobium retbaense DSM 5692]|uniref:Uncharacterized protein n=1 Tax=Desulfohalobium retbaense (strain ATCC 49708 / DSM 5692 / JCM 16813 / HR100) TaxID=485915 RepID=C8X427_DESRD|nr:hypothetical protein Dret_1890 [Desulfohalobium retbaense DSM 5692]
METEEEAVKINTSDPDFDPDPDLERPCYFSSIAFFLFNPSIPKFFNSSIILTI